MTAVQAKNGSFFFRRYTLAPVECRSAGRASPRRPALELWGLSGTRNEAASARSPFLSRG